MPLTARTPPSFRLSFTPWSRPLPVALLVMLMLSLAVPAAAEPVAGSGVDSAAGAGPVKPGYSRLVNFSAVLQPALAGGDEPRAVFAELTAASAVDIWTGELNQGDAPDVAAAAVRRQRQVVLALARRVAATAPDATVLFTVTDAVPGIGLLATPTTLRMLAGDPGVSRITAIVPKVPAGERAAGSGPPVAGDLDKELTGAGIRVGVIDTGIDYTHADFGGAGTAAAYSAALRSDTAPWAPPAGIAGGYDFVGDSYDAAPTTATGANPGDRPVPRPDADPLDCNGHGTRVAAAIAGRGVAVDRARGGSDAGQVPATDLPPGIAPQASLYAFKVFGCTGATDAVIPSLDRALDPDQDGNLSDRLDVVDLSLTSSTAALDDPETQVLDVLARFGVLPVVAAGYGRAESHGPAGASSLTGSVRALTVVPAPDITADSASTTALSLTPAAVPELTSPTVSTPVAAVGVAGTGSPDRSTGSTEVAVPDADVAAAGSTGSPLVGSGAGSTAVTADATAVAGGMAALVRQRHPGWTPEQVKAALVDTAVPGPADPAGITAAPGAHRHGYAGLVDADAAVGADLLAYSSTEPGAVSVSFGIVQADVRQQQVVATAAVVVQNTGDAVASLLLSYRSAADQPGVSYQVSPANMVLLPGASILATVTATITPGALHRTPADGISPQQRNPLTGLDEARQFTASTRGQLLLAPAGSVGDVIRLPVSAAVRPFSTTSAADGTLSGAPALAITGTGFSLSAPGDTASATQQSLVSVLELGYRSPAVPPCRTVPAAAATAGCSAGGAPDDLQAVGVGRTPAVGDDPGYLWFGLSTYQDMAAVGRGVLPTVDIDVNGDNTADYTLQVQAVPGTDLLYALLFDDRPAVAALTAIYPVNFNLGDVDTNATDSTVLLIPVDPAALGFRAGVPTFPIRYSVTLYSAAGAAENAMAADVTPALDYDVAAPGVTTANPLWQDQGGTGVPYRLAPGSTGADALVLHLHGTGPERAQMLRLAG